MVKPIFDITPFTTLDFPGKLACIAWFASCNMACLYCYNPQMVCSKGNFGIDHLYHFLESRKNLLQAVVLCGGEPTLWKKLPDYAEIIQKMGFQIKLDTNGSNPKMIKYLVQNQLIDYIALDFKALPDKYEAITQSKLFDNFKETLLFLIQSNFPFEVRTTCHSDLLSIRDLKKMSFFLHLHQYNKTFYLQEFLPKETLFPLKTSISSYTDEMLSFRNLKIIIRSEE